MKASSGKSSKNIAIASVLTALSLISLWASSVIGTGTLALLGISTCFSSVVFSYCGKKYGFLHYLAVSLLAFLLVPKGAQLIAYIMFLGYYPFVRQSVKQITFRVIIFTAVFALSFFLFKNILLPGISLTIYHYILGLIGSEIVFLIFDYAIFYFEIFCRERLSFLTR